jgi:hypothetical protein
LDGFHIKPLNLSNHSQFNIQARELLRRGVSLRFWRMELKKEGIGGKF